MNKIYLLMLTIRKCSCSIFATFLSVTLQTVADLTTVYSCLRYHQCFRATPGI